MFENPNRTLGYRSALAEIRPILKRAVLVSVIVNVLSLAPVLYMLQVYDRVLNSRSYVTLAMLTLLVLGIYIVLEVMEYVRAQLLHQAGTLIEARLGPRIFNAAFAANLRNGRSSVQGLEDLRTLREFFSTPAVTALLDAAPALTYLVLVSLISPALGWFSLAVAVVQVYIAYLTERGTRDPLTQANRGAIEARNYAGGALRQAQAVESMGMLDAIIARWRKRHREVLKLQAKASDVAGSGSAAAKLVQNILSSGLLGLACWLMLHGELAGGASMMIIASILGGKALAPLVQLIASWKSVVYARGAHQRIESLLESYPDPGIVMQLPPPQGRLSVDGVIAAAPGSQLSILRGVSFSLAPGRALAVVGPSASGKSTLARLLVGIWPAFSGSVRLDGVDVFQWNKMELGPHIGYLPERIELFDGTLAENIARFGEIDAARVEHAARAVGLHENILALPDGYQSRIGEEGCFLSGGQRQRVGLARAVYGNPRYVVLDEPNSSLDAAGEHALLGTLAALKAGGTTVVFITHRTNLLAVADFMLVLSGGQAVAFGPRDEVLARLRQPQGSERAQPAPQTA